MKQNHSNEYRPVLQFPGDQDFSYLATSAGRSPGIQTAQLSRIERYEPYRYHRAPTPEVLPIIAPKDRFDTDRSAAAFLGHGSIYLCAGGTSQLLQRFP